MFDSFSAGSVFDCTQVREETEKTLQKKGPLNCDEKGARKIRGWCSHTYTQRTSAIASTKHPTDLDAPTSEHAANANFPIAEHRHAVIAFRHHLSTHRRPREQNTGRLLSKLSCGVCTLKEGMRIPARRSCTSATAHHWILLHIFAVLRCKSISQLGAVRA
jgi:hypothetical protein